MIQSGGVIRDIRIFGNILSNIATKAMDIAKDLGELFPDKQIDKLHKENLTGPGINLLKKE